jgi:2'-5' RNA ligase
MTTIRTFIALHLPAAIEQTLLDTIAQYRPHFPAGSVRWVQPQQLHLTLRFLGETAVSHLPALQQGLDQIASHHAPLTLSLGALGCFPNGQRPRVFWVGLAGELVRLHALQREIEGLVNQVGWEREKRPFSPHLTLGRVNDARQLAGATWRGPLASGETQMRLATIALIESQLRPSGAIYTPRHVSRLAL